MKDFLKNVLSSLVALVLFGTLTSIFAIVSIISMAAMGSDTPSVKNNSVLVIPLKGVMEERSGDPSPMDMVAGNLQSAPSFTAVRNAILKATKSKKIKGIYLEVGRFGGGFAQMEELRQALLDFRKAGKWIIAYGENYGQAGYYLASTANKIYINPSGTINWVGIGGEPAYVKDALAKIGVKMIPVRVGKYKSAVEMFIEDKMSPANREQTSRYMTGLWTMMTTAVSKSRSIPTDSLNRYADRVITYSEPTEFLKERKFVDGLVYNDSIKYIVKRQLGIDRNDEIPMVSVSAMAQQDIGDDGDEIAVYYACGDIVDNINPTSFDSDAKIVGNTMCDDLEALANDDDVKAVVLRVNSPGGSAYASEQIWHAVEQLKARKPVVVSMSSMAASGGYYISCGADWIVAEPSTLTGSIGIFGVFPDVSELMTKKLGFKYDDIGTNRNSDRDDYLFSMGKGYGPEQLKILQADIDRGYMLFKSRVAQGRHLSMQTVEDIAQGHVYLASDAKSIKLVDELGGFDAAVKKAAQLAKLKEYHTHNYPAPASWMDAILESLNEESGTYLDEQARLALGNLYEPMRVLIGVRQWNPIQARMPYFINLH